MMVQVPNWMLGLTPLLLVVLALTLGPEELPEGQQRPGVPIPIKSPAPKVDGQRSQKPAFPVRPPAEVDHEAFIASFRRQSRAEVLPCLRQWQSPPASLLVTAVLTRGGRLENIRGNSLSRDLPGCFVPAVTTLEFSSLTAALDRPSVEISWRIDW